MHFFQIISILLLHLGYIKFTAAVHECNTKLTCSDCISSSPKCSWCEDIYYNKTEKYFHKKCDLVETHQRQLCSKINNPLSNSVLVKTSPLVGETRVSPQEITLKLRPEQPTKVDIKVKTPKNFPIDLYYLMDLSRSMRDDLAQIKTLGDILSREMADVTSNFRLGFGGFVDKPIGPYTRTKKEEIETAVEPGMQNTFGFRNYLPLDKDTTKFGNVLNNVNISYNVDVPEGSLEALMQVIVCNDEIGWRKKKKARRIVIITTDATFHYAGDGLLGGVVIPNDEKCYLNPEGLYTAWNMFDYPSLSQIRSKMIENQMIPIFATTGNTALYQKVAEFFGEASGAVADALNSNSSNVVPLIKDAYQKIAKTVSIKADASDGIDVKFQAKCGKEELKDSAFCNNIQIGEEVTFVTEVVASDCRHAGKATSFKLETPFDDVVVNVELLCECNCTDPIINSTHCTARGNLSCGMCFCDRDLYGGRFCQCTAEEAKNQTLCRVPGSNKPICSGKGTCDCGECVCDEPQKNKNNEMEYIYGDQCQCSNTTCPRSNLNQVCGGLERGSCECGKCNCTESWQGDACEDRCLAGEDRCFDNAGVMCSGKGTCKCNQCKCIDGYIGDFCQECVTNCPDPCQNYRECVKCRVFDTSDLSTAECEVECARWNITSHIVVDKVPDDRRCIARDEDDCSFVFTYNKDNITDTVQLVVQRDRICPAEPDILAIILGVIAGIVGIGLALLLIWKLLATIQDRREFAKFEKDRQNPKWDSGENPIYKKATSTFQNPMYGNKPEEEEPLTT
uniref:Integrin beta n=1 Tax=Podocoryna carnea TaxID=6096 RepID=Q9GSF3_PODCA|nr:integrin beta chain [Podocoryna carnea]